MYVRAQDEGSLERAAIMDRVASGALQVGASGLSTRTRAKGGADGQGSACRSLAYVGGTRLAGPQGADSFLLIPPKGSPSLSKLPFSAYSSLALVPTQGLKVRFGYLRYDKWPQTPSQETRPPGSATGDAWPTTACPWGPRTSPLPSGAPSP